MTLGRMQVTDFRCLQSAALEFDPKFTLIHGPNGSGKTSLLEGVYVLGRGRSFRTRRTANLVRRGAERFVVFGEAETEGRRVPLGVEGTDAGVRAKISGGKVATLAELARQLPVQIIDPEVHRLIEEGPSQRRRFMDWGVFHVEHSFLDHWQRYHQVLRQRNAALKSQQTSLIAAWDSDLVRYGDLISSARSRYVNELAIRCAPLGLNLLGQEVTLTYRTGWSKDQSFSEALERNFTSDRELGVTQAGPHRAEMGIRLEGLPVKDRISRGQQKLLAAALLVAQINLLPDTSVRPTLLLDDPAAELDDERLARLIVEIAGHATQLIVTTLHGEFAAFGSPGRRFTIAGGVLTPE